MSPSVPLIKGYLPVRLELPPFSDDYEDETYFYVREHQGQTSSSEGSKTKSTLFVVNAPVVPGVSTKLLLRSIFGRYANVSRVTVVQNPRKDEVGTPQNQMKEGCPTSSFSWSSKVKEPSFLAPVYSEGKFAHVVFNSTKDMKKALRALQDAMKTKSSSKKKGDDEHQGLKMEQIEIQTLSDETIRLYRRERERELGKDADSSSDENEMDDGGPRESKTGIHAIAERYQASCIEMSREELLEECNRVMKAYEDAEEEKRRAKEATQTQPDDDGFVKVSYSSAAGSKLEMEESITATTPARRRGHKRSRKKKEALGSQEQKDFYRFQRKENKKRTLEELRMQFEEDLRKVKRMKEDRRYRPF